MPIAWFAIPYKRQNPGQTPPIRYCAIEDFRSQIQSDGGAFSVAEGLGDNAIVKVRASDALLTTIGNTQGNFATPRRWTDLVSSLADMTAGERNQIQSKLLSLGYTQAEIDSAMGASLAAWQLHNFGNLLSLFVSRRNKPRYDSGTDTIILDGPNQPTRKIADVNEDVK